MATTALVVKIGADLSDFNSKMQAATDKIGDVGKKMQSIGSTLSVAVTAPIVALGAASVLAFDKQAQGLAQVETAVRSTGMAAGFSVDELAKKAADLQKNSIFGDEQIMKEMTANLLTFTNIAGQEFDRTQQAAIDLATRMGTDLKSATIQLGKALNDPVANLSALSRSGIQFSEDQKEVIKSMAESGRMADAQRVILSELERQFGGAGAAAAAAGLGPMRQLSNSIGDLTEDFGKIILDALAPFIDFGKRVVERLLALDDSTKKWIVIIGGAVAAIGPLIAIIGTLLAVLPSVVAGFTLISGALAAMSASGGPIFLTVAAIAGLVAGIVALYKNWDSVTAFMQGAWLTMKLRIMGGITELLKGMSSLFDWIPGAESLFSGAIAKMEQKTGQAAVALADFNLKRAEQEVAARQVAEAEEEAATAVRRLGEELGGVSREARSAEQLLAQYGGVQAAVGAQADYSAEAMDEMRESFVKMNQTWTETNGVTLRTVDGMKDIERAQRDAKDETVDWTAAIRAEGGLSNALDEVNGKIGGKQGLLQMFGEGGVQGVFSGVVDKITGGKGVAGALMGLATTAIPALGPAFKIASGLMKTFGIDTQKVFDGIANGVKNIVSGIGKTISGLFAGFRKESEKEAAMSRFLASVSTAGIDVTNLDAAAKSKLKQLMAAPMTQGVSQEALLSALGLTEADIARTVDEAVTQLVAQTGTATTSALDKFAIILQNMASTDLVSQLGLAAGTDIIAPIEQLLGVSVAEAQARLAQLMANVGVVSVDPDGETGIAIGVRPEDIGEALNSAVDMIGSTLSMPMSGLASVGEVGLPEVDRVASSQTININLDGQTIAQATMPYWSQELEIYGTNR